MVFITVFCSFIHAGLNLQHALSILVKSTLEREKWCSISIEEGWELGSWLGGPVESVSSTE